MRLHFRDHNGKYNTSGDRVQPPFPGLAFCAYHEAVEWSKEKDKIPPFINKDGDCLKLELPPKAGEQKIIRVSHPFDEKSNAEFWVLFKPAASFLCGWDSYPEHVDSSAFVKCKILDVFSNDADNAWVRVDIMDSILFSDVLHKIPEQKETRSIFNEIYAFEWCSIMALGEWLYYENYDGEDYMGSWILMRKVENKVHVLALGGANFEQEDVFLGNMVLSQKTYDELIVNCAHSAITVNFP